MDSNKQVTICILPDGGSHDCEEMTPYESGLSPQAEYQLIYDWKTIPDDYVAVRFVTIGLSEHVQDSLSAPSMGSGFHITSG